MSSIAPPIRQTPIPKEIGEAITASYYDDFLVPNLGGWYLTGAGGAGTTYDVTAFGDANHPATDPSNWRF
jgi:hypothetical protein